MSGLMIVSSRAACIKSLKGNTLTFWAASLIGGGGESDCNWCLLADTVEEGCAGQVADVMCQLKVSLCSLASCMEDSLWDPAKCYL